MVITTFVLLAVCITAGVCFGFGFALATKREAARWESIAKRAADTIIEARDEAQQARGERNILMVMLQDVASGYATATMDEEGRLHVSRNRPIVSH